MLIERYLIATASTLYVLIGGGGLLSGLLSGMANGATVGMTVLLIVTGLASLAQLAPEGTSAGPRRTAVGLHGLTAACFIVILYMGDLGPASVLSVILPVTISAMCIFTITRPRQLPAEEEARRSRERLAFAPVVTGAGSAIVMTTILVALGILFTGYGPAPVSATADAGASPRAFLSGPGIVDTEPGVTTAKTRPRLHYPELDFTLERPGSEWIPMTPRYVNDDAVIALMNAQEQVAFMVIAERVGEAPLTPELLAEAMQTLVRGRTDDVEFLEQSPQRVDTIDGLSINFRGVLGGRRFHYVSWMGYDHGVVYQLITFGPPQREERIAQLARDMWSRFRHIPLDKSTDAVPANLALDQDRGGNAFELPDGWRRWDAIGEEIPGAGLGAIRADASALAVVPCPLGDAEPPLESIAHAFLGLFDIEYPSAGVVTAPTSSDEELHLEVARGEGAERIEYALRVVRGAGTAWLVAGWSVPQGAEPSDTWDLVRSVPLGDDGPAIAAAANDANAWAHELLLNAIGLDLARQRRFAAAGDSFRAAYSVTGHDPEILANALNMELQLGQYARGLALYESAPPTLRENHELSAWAALLLSRAGRTDEAIVAFARLFESGYRGDALLDEAVVLMIERGATARALDLIDTYLSHADSLEARIIKANVLGELGRHDEAIMLLEATLATAPAPGALHAAIAFALIETYQLAGRHADAIDRCERILAAGDINADVYALRGGSELGLGRFEAAKASLEQALRLDPAHRGAKVLLNHVASFLGEGDHLAVSEPIDPVPPPDLPEDVAVEAGGFGAYYRTRSRAVRFEPGRLYKSTDRFEAEIVTAVGVETFSSLHFAFDPLVERLYVNELRVERRSVDGRTHVEWEGDPSAYYIVDETGNGIASHDQVLVVPVSGLAPGRSLIVTVTRALTAAPFELPFSAYTLAAGLPVGRSTLELSGELDAVVFESTPDVEPAIDGERVTWTIEQPPVYMWEPRQDVIDRFLPTVWSTARGMTWAEVGASYLESIAEAMTPDPSARIAAFARPESDDAVGDAASFVQNACVYKALAFGRRAWLPETAGATLEHRYGDCKAHAVLLWQMLTARGVEAHLALVNSIAPVRPGLPSLDQFNHMIVAVPADGGWRYLDTTVKTTDARLPIPHGLAGRRTLILDPSGARLGTIPAYGRDRARVVAERHIRSDEHGDLTIEEQVTFSGHATAYLRGLLRSSEATEWKALLQQQMSTVLPIELRALDVDGVNDTSRDLSVSMSYVTRGRFAEVDEKLYGRLPAPWERLYCAEEYVEARATPFVLEFPLELETRVRFDPPAGFTVRMGDDTAVDVEGAFIRMQSSRGPESDGLSLQWTLRRTSGAFAPEAYAGFQHEMTDATRPIECSVVLRPAETFVQVDMDAVRPTP